MAKPWARLEIGYMDHPKFLALNGNAICLWHEAKNYCDARQTDGLIPREALKTFRFASKKTIQMLLTSCGPKADGTPYAPLWSEHHIGYKMHDYLDHNDCREEVLARIARADDNRDWDRRRKQLSRDSDLISQIRARDGDDCRYCGRAVCWHDRRGPNAGTYDHVEPRGANTLENVVVACRGCNSVKGARTPKEAGMTLRPAPNLAGSSPRPSPVQGQDLAGPTSTETETETTTEVKKTRTSAASSDAAATANHPIKEFLTLYEQQFREMFNDAPSLVNGRDAKIAKTVLEKYGREKAHALLRAFFASRDEFIQRTGYGLNVFAGQLNKLIVGDRPPMAATGTEGRGRTGAAPKGKYDGIGIQDE